MSFAPSPDLTKPNHGASCGPPGHRAPRHGESFREKSRAPEYRTLPRAPVAPKRLGGHARLVVAKWRAPRTAQPVRAWRGRPRRSAAEATWRCLLAVPAPRARERERARECDCDRKVLEPKPSGGVWCVRRAPWLPVGSTVLVLPFGFCARAGGPCGCGAVRRCAAAQARSAFRPSPKGLIVAAPESSLPNQQRADAAAADRSGQTAAGIDISPPLVSGRRPPAFAALLVDGEMMNGVAPWQEQISITRGPCACHPWRRHGVVRARPPGGSSWDPSCALRGVGWWVLGWHWRVRRRRRPCAPWAPRF
jgi:hypothetical protein